MRRRHIRSVVDLGCGDWQFSRYIDWSDMTYVGVEVVPSVVERNQHEFGNSNIRFQIFELLAKLPTADLLVCKDVLQHLPNVTVKSYLGAFRNKFKFSLITNDEEPVNLQNIDIDIGGWRTCDWTGSRSVNRARWSSPGRCYGARQRREVDLFAERKRDASCKRRRLKHTAVR